MSLKLLIYVLSILTFRSVSLVASAADQLVILQDGVLVTAGPPALLPDLISNGILEDEPQDITQMTVESLTLNGGSAEASPEISANGTTSSKKGKLVLEEERAVGRVPKKILLDYLQQMGGPMLIALLIGACILMELASLVNTFFVGLWSGKSFCLNVVHLFTILKKIKTHTGTPRK